MTTFKEEVLELIEELVAAVQHMREEGDRDLRTVIYQIKDLRDTVARMED